MERVKRAAFSCRIDFEFIRLSENCEAGQNIQKLPNNHASVSHWIIPT